MDTILKVNNQSNGRDKIARLVQYTSRLVWHQLEKRNANKYSVDRVRNLETTLSSFRKILRLGRCVDIFYTALNSMHHEDPWLRVTLTINKLAQALFLYADHVVWLSKSGFLKSDSDKWTRIANKFWLVSITANLAKDFYEILQLLDINRSTFLKPSRLINGSVTNINFHFMWQKFYFIVNCHRDIFIDTVKDSCDLFIPLTALGFVKFSPSTVGILGATSSMAALFTVVKNVCDARGF